MAEKYRVNYFEERLTNKVKVLLRSECDQTKTAGNTSKKILACV